MIPSIETVIKKLRTSAHEYAEIAMLCRTHGQPATPSTLGKEFANYVYRIEKQLRKLKNIEIYGKFNGAVGNFNAHSIAYPTINWIELSRQLIEEKLKFKYNPYTTQIESHDWNSEIFDTMVRINTILIDFARDIWGYVSFNYFKQLNVAGEIGSSTMPHKINPIDFENAEGQLGISNALFTHLSQKLPISRFQRDLTDSTVQRSMGTAFGHSLIAYTSLLRGINKLEVNEQVIYNDLNSNWEVLAEPIQTVMRKFSVKNAYERLKELTRGKRVDQQGMQEFVNSLTNEIPEEAKQQLLKLTPHTYIGYAAKLAKEI